MTSSTALMTGRLAASKPASKQDEQNGQHDSVTMSRAVFTFGRTFIEHLGTWGSLVDLIFGLQPYFILSAWGYVIGGIIGSIWAYLDARAHVYADSANDSIRNKDIRLLMDKGHLTQGIIETTPISGLNETAIQAHVIDDGIINWSFFVLMLYTGVTEKLNNTITATVFGTTPYPIIENLVARCFGAYLGYCCAEAEERTITENIRRYTAWEKNHHLLTGSSVTQFSNVTDPSVSGLPTSEAVKSQQTAEFRS